MNDGGEAVLSHSQWNLGQILHRIILQGIYSGLSKRTRSIIILWRITARICFGPFWTIITGYAAAFLFDLFLHNSSKRRWQETTHDKTVVWYTGRSLNIALSRLTVPACDYKVQRVALLVCRLTDNLFEAKQRQQTEKALRFLIIHLVNVQVEVSADNDLALILVYKVQQQLCQFSEEQAIFFFCGWPVDDDANAWWWHGP